MPKSPPLRILELLKELAGGESAPTRPTHSSEPDEPLAGRRGPTKRRRSPPKWSPGPRGRTMFPIELGGLGVPKSQSLRILELLKELAGGESDLGAVNRKSTQQEVNERKRQRGKKSTRKSVNKVNEGIVNESQREKSQREGLLTQRVNEKVNENPMYM